ncbi:N-formimino-L-glutamate deiminase [compost metagenome]
MGQRLDPVLIQILQVIHREGTEVGGERAAPQVGELLHVPLHREIVLIRRQIDLLGLGQREADVLAEDVHRIRQTRLGRCRDDLLADGLDPGVRIVAVFGRHRMGCQQGGLDPNRQRLPQSAGDPQHLELVRQGEAIAGLDLHGSDPFPDQGLDPRHRQLIEQILAGRAGGPYCGEYATPLAGDVAVGHALLAQLELLGPAAGKDEVGVAIDEARGHQPALHVAPVGGIGPLEILHGDQGVDPALMHAEGMGFQQTVVRQIGAQGGGCHVEPDPLAVQQFLVHTDL